MTEDGKVAFQRIITRSYTDVEITQQGINTDQFLEATDGLIKMFGIVFLGQQMLPNRLYYN